MQQENAWTLTDDDSYQHVRKINEQTYELIEIGLSNPEKRIFEVYADTVCLQDYPDAEIRQILRGFGYATVAEVVEEYGETANQIIAECIFEHYGSFAVQPVFHGPFYASRCFIDDYMRKGGCNVV